MSKSISNPPIKAVNPQGQAQHLNMTYEGELKTTSQLVGNTSADGTGTDNHLYIDGNGVARVQNIATSNIAPANTANSDHASHSQSFAVGIRGHTNIADRSTGTFLACDATGALIVRLDNSNDSVRVVGQNTAGANKGVGVEDTDGAVLGGGKVVVADPNSTDGTRQVLRLNTKNELHTTNTPNNVSYSAVLATTGGDSGRGHSSVANSATLDFTLDTNPTGRFDLVFLHGHDDGSGSSNVKYYGSTNNTDFFLTETKTLTSSINLHPGNYFEFRNDIDTKEKPFRYWKVVFENLSGGAKLFKTGYILTKY